MELINTKQESDILDALMKKNSWKYNLHKASEELQELALVLNQTLLKPYKVDEQEIINEMGDVMIRLSVLIRIFPIDKVNRRIAEKLSKYKEYNDSELYDQI